MYPVNIFQSSFLFPAKLNPEVQREPVYKPLKQQRLIPGVAPKVSSVARYGYSLIFIPFLT